MSSGGPNVPTAAPASTAPLAKKAPADFLRGAVGRPVVVRLTSGTVYKGVLMCVDAFSNVALEQTEEYDADGALRYKYGDCFLRGNNGALGGRNVRAGRAGGARLSTPARPRARAHGRRGWRPAAHGGLTNRPRRARSPPALLHPVRAVLYISAAKQGR